jgi:predicted nucleotidyltransferase
MASTDETKPSEIEFYGGYQVYSESGVDLTLLRRNLERSVEERLENNRRALSFVQAIQPLPGPDARSSAIPRSACPMIDASPIILQLIKHDVEFVLIGGMAMRAQGSAHITEDIDFCYRRTPANIKALSDAFAELHPYLRGAPPGLPFRFDAPTIQAGLNFTLTTDHGDVDFLGEVSGIGNFDQVLGRTTVNEMYGLKVQVLSVDGLIAAKKAAGRGKDRQHLLELEELKKLRDAAPDKEKP